MTRTPPAPRIALVAALLAGAFGLTADAAPAASTVPVTSDALVVPGDVERTSLIGPADAEATAPGLNFAEITETIVTNWLTGKRPSMTT